MPTAPEAPLTLAYISDGSLFLWREGETPRKVESAFARQVRDRAAALDRKHAWKGKGRDARFRSQIWGRSGGEQEAEYTYVSVADVCADGERVIYALQSGPVSGVFRIGAADAALGEQERRLFHTTDLAVSDLGGVEQHGYVVCSLRGDKAASHIAVLHEDGSEVTELTAGDSVDRAPSWVPGRDRVLVYQTAGIYRDARGEIVRFGPSVVQQLDIAEGELALALEEPGYDLMAPKVDADGTLFCMRRRYRAAEQVSALRLLWRIASAPFWLLYALVVWLGLFIQIYTGKRMVAPGQHSETGGPVRARVQTPAPEDARPAEQEEEKDELPPGVREQELIRCTRAGKPELIERGVLSFDVAPDGRLIYSDGRRLYARAADGTRRQLLRANEISAVRVVEGTSADRSGG